jgi:hypothetical protein
MTRRVHVPAVCSLRRIFDDQRGGPEGVRRDEFYGIVALATARAFGGQDYNGYHSFMALCPANAMATALPLKETPREKCVAVCVDQLRRGLSR